MQASLVSVSVTAWRFNIWGLQTTGTLNFNNNTATAAVFLDIEEAFDITWHIGLLYKLSDLKFSIMIIIYFLSQRKFGISVEVEMSTARDIQWGVPQGTVLSPFVQSIYNDTHQASMSI
jgi:hypothetical protein